MAQPRVATASSNVRPYVYTDDQRMRGRALMARIDRIRQRYPLCCICAARGITRAFDEVDHIHALEDCGPDTEANCWGLCHTCHVDKTNAEEERRANGVLHGPPLAWLPPRPPELNL